STVPLWTPEGRHGMRPALALRYSNIEGDSPVGLGWSVSGGMSMIHRCATNTTRSSNAAAVKFDATDRLCLDGQSLFVVNGLPNGAFGAQYRTEPDTFVDVVIDDADSS